jgi:hypothetical protein
VIKLIRLRWAEHVACVGERRSPYRFLVEKPEESRPLGRRKPRWENSKWIFKKWGGVMHWIEGQVSGCCECGNETLGSIKFEEFLD